MDQGGRRWTAVAAPVSLAGPRREDPAVAARSTSSGAAASQKFTAEERAAMRERAKELKEAQKGAEAEQALLAKIAELPEPDRGLAERIHALIREHAPSLAPRTWYGMPAYAKDGEVLCFFQAADKFKVRYATLGFQANAALDEGAMWPTAFAVIDWTPEVERRIVDLVVRAAG